VSRGEVHEGGSASITSIVRIAAVTAAVFGILALAAASAWGLGAGGIKANRDSYDPKLSHDGGVVAFESVATNLDPAHLAVDNGAEIFARDLQTGVTSLVSRATGTTSEDGNVNSFAPDISANGRFVAFNSSSSNLSPFHNDDGFGIFVRDLQTNTTTVASLRSDGGNCHECHGASISGDGRYVAFSSRFERMTADDTDNRSDSYVRDMQTGTNTLVSRATGASGVKGNSESFSVAISDNGRWVVFESAATNLSPDDTDSFRDMYVRDLQTHTTTLVTRASGATGPKANGGSGEPEISGDGRFVAFYSRATNLDPADTDTSADIFVRDLQTDTTVLASRASGASGEAGNDDSFDPILSADGRFVSFSSSAWNLHPDDSVPDDRDSYARDLQTDTTILVSRANGADGAKGNRLSFHTHLSGDGRYATFASSASNLAPDDPDDVSDIYVRDLQDHVTSLESRATPGYERYVRPAGATPIRVPLVPAYTECVTANRTHGPPLAHGSCAPPGPASPHLTVGVRDIGRSLGYVRFGVKVGSPVGGADDSDVNIGFSLTNVMNAADFSDYTGELRGQATIRITDKSSETSGGTVFESTVSDFSFEFTTPCVETASTAGSTCSLTTTADAIVPGFAPEGNRTIYGLEQVKVLDGGPDGDADTPDNSLLAVQGLFVP
jgi:hypothetical protein